MEKIIGMKWSFPWPMGSSLPSMVLAGIVYWLFKGSRNL